MTLILQPSLGFDHLDTLPLIGAMAAGKAINSQLGVRTNVRWPNDIVVGRRKLAGVLAESRFSGNQSKYVLLGLGINANFLPRELIDFAPTSTTLLEICGSPVDREDLICALLLEIEQLYDQAVCNRDDELMNLLHGLDCSSGQRVEIKKGNEEISGVLEGYETLTKVRVRTTQGRLTTLETSSVVSVSYVDL
jgi:BirA family biotin operon repressor/biotin-[acetyl-CoA-carboxylase] ligase